MKLFAFITRPWPSPPREEALAIARRAKVDHAVQLLQELHRPDLAFLLERGLPYSDRNDRSQVTENLIPTGGVNAIAAIRTTTRG